jgi:hypothetical protein
MMSSGDGGAAADAHTSTCTAAASIQTTHTTVLSHPRVSASGISGTAAVHQQVGAGACCGIIS